MANGNIRIGSGLLLMWVAASMFEADPTASIVKMLLILLSGFALVIAGWSAKQTSN